MENAASSSDVKVVTNIVHEAALRKAQARALKIFSDAVLCTYGPLSGYTIYSQGNPSQPDSPMVSNITKDGFTVLKHINVDKPIELFLKDNIRDICVSVIKQVGDGTSAAIILSRLIFDGLLEFQKKINLPKRRIIKSFKEVLEDAAKRIEANKRETTIDDIYNIALTALNGQEEYAQMIKEIYEKAGMSVFIDVAISNDEQSKTVIYNGMNYNVGYISPAFINTDENSCILNNPDIYVFESPIDTPDMISILQLIINKNLETPVYEFKKAMQAKKPKLDDLVKPTPTLIITPHISRDMNSYLDQVINAYSSVTIKQRLPLCIVSGIDNYNQYLLDIMSMTGAKFIKKYLDKETYENDKQIGLVPNEKNLSSFAGKAERVIIDALSTRIINPANMYDEQNQPTEFYNNYVMQLEDLLHKYEETRVELVKIGQLKRRINILKGNMVDFYVGGIGISDRDALKDSVEDAVLNCRSAAQEGVGYGASYEGFKAFNELGIEIDKVHSTNEELLKADDLTIEQRHDIELNQYDLLVRKAVIHILLNAYTELMVQLYLPLTDNNFNEAMKLVIEGLANEDENKRCPLNVLTQEYDKKVLTSIKTEPAILTAISKIISLLFDTNQFLLPSPQFNIYEMTEETTSTLGKIKIPKSVEDRNNETSTFSIDENLKKHEFL